LRQNTPFSYVAVVFWEANWGSKSLTALVARTEGRRKRNETLCEETFRKLQQGRPSRKWEKKVGIFGKWFGMAHKGEILCLWLYCTFATIQNWNYTLSHTHTHTHRPTHIHIFIYTHIYKYIYLFIHTK